MARIRHQLASAVSCAILLLGVTAASGQTVFDWNGSSSINYGDVFNWTPLGVPNTASETARFDIPGSFDVTLSSGTTTTVSDLIVNVGDINFAANASVFATYETDDDALIEGGDFTLSRVGGNGDVVLNVGDDLRVTGGSTLLIGQGSDMTVADDVTIAASSGGGEVVTVDGAGSTLDIGGNVRVAQSGLSGTLAYQDFATGVIAGRIDVGVSNANNTSGELSVFSGANLTTGAIRVGSATNGLATGQQAQVFVNGFGTSLTMFGASTLEIGSTFNSDVTAELFVQNFGQFATGTGAIHIVNSGRLVIAGSGAFTNNGQLTIDGGTIDEVFNGGFINGAGSSLTATGGAQLNFTSDKRIDNGVTWTLQGGADYRTDTAFDDLAVGQTTNGALIVENSGTSVDLSMGGSGIVGSLGGTGSMTVRDDATATFGRLAIGSSSAAGTTGVLNIEDGAVVDTGELEVAELAGPTTTSTVNIGGAGAFSQLIVNGSGTIGIGDSTPGDGSGAIHIDQSGELVTGSGQTTIRQTGLIAIEGGALRAHGDVVVDGGELNQSSGTFDLQPGLTLTARNDGQVNFSSSHLINDETTYLIQSGADLTTTGMLFVGVIFGQSGELIVEGAGSTLDVTQGFFVGDAGGAGVATIRDGATATLTSSASIASTPDGGLSTGAVRVETGATVLSGGLSIGAQGGEFTSGSLVITGAGSSWEPTILTLGHSSEGQATIDVLDGGAFSNFQAATFNTTGLMTIDGGTVALDSHVAAGGKIDLISGLLTSGSDWVIQTGGVLGHVETLGPGATLATTGAADGVIIQTGGVLALDGGALDVRSITNNGGTFLFNSGTLTLDGGSLTGLANLIVPTNGAFLANGVYTLPVAAQGGSTVMATGDLTLGDASSVAGFYSNGQVTITAGTTTLLDANDAVFDSGANVTLGDGARTPANLVADNGLTLDFGGNITGFGAVETPDDPTTPLINNGHITGVSRSEPIVLTGYVKGVGTCDNCIITGTDSPGFSPATVLRGSVSYNGVLQIELGGTATGDFDRLEHVLGAGAADLGGALEVTLIDGFTPQLGDTFQFLTATTLSGQFTLASLPDLGPLTLQAVYEPTAVTLIVIPELTGDYNADGRVDAIDYAVWRESLGQTGVGLAADGDLNGAVDSGDFELWKANYKAIAAAGVGSGAVPEPLTLVLLAGLVTPLATRSGSMRWLTVFCSVADRMACK